MANDSTSGGSNNGLLYGIIGALCAVVVGGGVYLYKMDKPGERAVQAAIPETAAQPAPPPPIAVVAPRSAGATRSHGSYGGAA